MSDTTGKHPTDSPTAIGERPTLKTLAQATGLAVATVSRALHDAPDIGEETKRRVNEKAREIGYRPNRAGVRLRTGKTNVISLVLSTEHEMVNHHTGRLISSIAGALRGTAYHMIVTPYFPSEDIMAPIDYILETGSADAIIMNQIEPEDRRVKRLMDLGFPFAAHGRTIWADRHAYYDFDNGRFGEIAVETFHARGRKTVAIMSPPTEQTYARDYVAAAKAAGQRLGLEVRLVQGATTDEPQTDVARAMTEHLRAFPETDAMMTTSTLSAMTLTATAEALGREIGRDIDLFSKQNDRFLHLFRPGILALTEDISATGRFLALAAIDRIDNPTGAPMQSLEIPKWDTEQTK